jgi:hypothetical protein
MPSCYAIYVNSHHTIKWPSMCHSTSRDCASCDIATSWSQVATKLWTKPPRPPQMFIISRLVLNSFGLFWNGSELMIYCNVFQNIFSVYNIYIYTYIYNMRNSYRISACPGRRCWKRCSTTRRAATVMHPIEYLSDIDAVKNLPGVGRWSPVTSHC